MSVKEGFMRFENRFLKAFTFLARLVGVIWILGSLIAFLSAFTSVEDRWLRIGVAFFLLFAGLGLLLAKRATSSDTETIRRFVDQVGKPR